MSQTVNEFSMWLWTRNPLLKTCLYNDYHGYETWWRGVIIGRYAFGIMWRTPKGGGVS